MTRDYCANNESQNAPHANERDVIQVCDATYSVFATSARSTNQLIA